MPLPLVRPLSVAIADDHAVVRRGVRLLLGAGDGFDVVGEAADAAGARRVVAERRPDVLVLDLHMPGGSGLDAIRGLRADHPGTEIVVLSVDSDPAFAYAATEAGALGFVLKASAADELVDAVTAAADGEPYVSAALDGRS
jgi:DNA-binding NarL/FixJ family response regulator